MLKKIIVLLLITLVMFAGCTESTTGDVDINEASMTEDFDDHGDGEGTGFKATGIAHNEVDIMTLPFEEVSADELIALEETLFDEFKAQKTYEFVLNKFGDLKPFSNIVNAEQNHYNEIKAIYEKYDLTVPLFSNDFNFEINSVLDACSLAVTAEEENVALYVEKFKMVDNQDIHAVFTDLMLASKDKHLPAFQRCVLREE
jgi:hypothetical protein